MLKTIWKEHTAICCSIIICILVGLCAGAFSVNNLSSTQVSELSDYMGGFSEIYANQSISAGNLLVLALGENFQGFGLLLLAGMTIIGLPLIYLLCAARSFLCGFSIGVFLRAFSARGIVLICLTLAPTDLLKFSAFFVLGIHAVLFSLEMLKLLTKKDLSVNFQRSIVRFLRASLIAMALMLGGILYETFLTPVFLRFLLG